MRWQREDEVKAYLEEAEKLICIQWPGARNDTACIAVVALLLKFADICPRRD
jgi:hypothetical protein